MIIELSHALPELHGGRMHLVHAFQGSLNNLLALFGIVPGVDGKLRRG